jgi:hypothetical protein
LVALPAAFLWVQYARMPFNAEGRYFDPGDEVVYSVDGRDAWGAIALIALGIAIAAGLVWYRLGREPPRTARS